MALYRVTYNTVASVVFTVEAENEDDARATVDEQWSTPTLCGFCSLGSHGQPGIDLGEWEPDDSEHGVWLVETR